MNHSHDPRRPMLLAALMAQLLTPAAAAADPPTALLDAAHAAVSRGAVEKTRLLGFVDEKDSFRETPHGGAVLVGFDVSLGKWVGNAEIVFGIEPLYLTSYGVVVSTKSYGMFPSNLPSGPQGRDLKAKLTRVVRAKARPGYAVGGLTLRSGLWIDGLSVTFHRIKGAGLDREQSYVSDWIGSRSGGSEASLTTIGDAAVGIFGARQDDRVSAIGLITAPEPVVEEAKPDPAPVKHSARAVRAAKRAARQGLPGRPAAPAAAKAVDVPGQPAGVDETTKWLIYAALAGAVVAVGLVLAFRTRGQPAAEGGPTEDQWPTAPTRPAGPEAGRVEGGEWSAKWPTSHSSPSTLHPPRPEAAQTVGRCRKCSHVVWPDDRASRLPAWCPLCQSDLERVPADSVPPPAPGRNRLLERARLGSEVSF